MIFKIIYKPVLYPIVEYVPKEVLTIGMLGFTQKTHWVRGGGKVAVEHEGMISFGTDIIDARKNVLEALNQAK